MGPDASYIFEPVPISYIGSTFFVLALFIGFIYRTAEDMIGNRRRDTQQRAPRPGL